MKQKLTRQPTVQLRISYESAWWAGALASGTGEFYPGYPLPKRGVFYCARMLSSQYGTEFVDMEYNKLKKVYSIWICLEPPKKKQNTIKVIRLREENVVGHDEDNDPKEDYDLEAVVMVYLGDQDSETENGLLKLLDEFFSQRPSLEKLRGTMQEAFGLEMPQDLKEGMSEMCDLGEVMSNRLAAEANARAAEQIAVAAAEANARAAEQIAEAAAEATHDRNVELTIKFLKAGWTPQQTSEAFDLSLDEAKELDRKWRAGLIN